VRIAALDLIAYGPFRGLELDLSAPGVHLVFGRNEAGKSTTLRAITGLLYGIDVRTRDAHVHRPAELRIGGTLVGEDGARVRVVRRKSVAKGGPNTLLDERGQALDEAIVERLLHGVSEETFRHAFGLDHETLRVGGQALLDGKGDVGGSLFDASVGGGIDARRLLGELADEADRLYKPRASAPPLNEALKAFAEAQKLVKDRQSLPEAYVTQQQGLAAAQADRKAKGEARAALAARRGHLERLQARAPRERRRAQLALALGEVRALVGHEARVTALHARLAAYEKADRDRRAEAAEVELLRDRTIEASRRAGLDPTAAPANMDERVSARLGKLVAEREKLIERVDGARAHLERAERERARLREAAVDAPAPPELALARLARALETARALGDAKSRLASEESKVEKRLREVEARTAALRVFVRPAAELVALSLPTDETMDRLVAKAAELALALQRTTERAADLAEKEAQIARQIAERSGDFAPPDAAALRQAREDRERAWARLREERGADAKTTATLEAAVDRAMVAADAVADRMILDADRVTVLARLHAEATTLARQRALAVEQRDATRADREALDAEHARAWAPAKIVPLDVVEMKGWLGRLAQVIEAYARLEEARSDAASLAAAIDAARADLVAALVETGETTAADAKASRTIGEWIDAAAASSTRREVAVRAAAEAAQAMAKLEAQLDERVTALARDEAALGETRARLAELAAPLGLPGDASGDEVMSAIDSVKRIFALQDKRSEAAARAALAEQDAKSFEDDVARAQADLAPDLAGQPAREIVAALVSRSRRAVVTETELRNVERELAELGEQVAPAELVALADDADALRRALEEAASDLDALDRELSTLDHTLGGLQKGLDEMRVDSGAAEASAQAQAALARVRDNVERYCRAKAAAVILGREIERYREENQGPMLGTASRLFERLTMGAFTGVRAGYDERDRAALRCVRQGTSAEVDVAGLSEGTRDQLYLSLRLATLLRHAQTAAPMPLVLDDVLIHFDDERSRAALAVIAEVAASMQVLFFTHHARLVEIARAAVPEGQLTVHELTPAQVTSAVASPAPTA